MSQATHLELGYEQILKLSYLLAQLQEEAVAAWAAMGLQVRIFSLFCALDWHVIDIFYKAFGHACFVVTKEKEFCHRACYLAP